MGIYIPNMEMPSDRRVELLVFPNGYVGIYDVRGRYLANALAVTIPEGHGRLGDLDALMKNIGDVPYKGAVRRVLMSAPTIVPAEGGTDNGT